MAESKRGGAKKAKVPTRLTVGSKVEARFTGGGPSPAWTHGASAPASDLYGATPRHGVLDADIPRRVARVPAPNLHRSPSGSRPSDHFRVGPLN